MTNDEAIVSLANEVDENLRALCHLTQAPSPVPAPLLYDITGNLKLAIGSRLGDLCNQLRFGLERSLTTHDVYDRNRDPLTSVTMAGNHLLNAERLARELGEALSQAQVAINLQGYNDHKSESPS
jgi:hypothetical protein